MGAARKYPDELRDRAVRLVLDLVKDQDASVTAACRKVGGELGIKADTLRGWAKQAQIDRGMRPGAASADAARIRALERENAELRRVNAILRTASAFFRGRARPPVTLVVAFIEAFRDQFGAGPMCRALRQAGVAISPSGYYAARARPPPARVVRDAALEKQILRVWKDSGERYGAWKVWDQLNREGIAAARCTVERLMRKLGLRGVRRGGYKVRTTRSDPSQDRPADLVNRDFAPDAPDRLWVVDFTFVSTWAGTAYTAFVIDAFARLIAGWRTAASHGTDLVLDALVMAVTYRARQGVKVAGLIHHSDAGAEGEFNRSSQHLDLEVYVWDGQEDGQQLQRGGRRCVRRGALRWPDEKACSGSGWRSPGECRVRTPALRLVCPRWLVRAGSATAVGSGRSAWLRCRGGTCRWRSGRRSRSCAPGGAVSGRSPGVSPGRRRRSRGSCAGTLRPGAAGWSTGPRLPSGTRTGGHAARRSRSWLRTGPCGSTCKTGSPARSPGRMAQLCRARMCAGSGVGTAAGRTGAGPGRGARSRSRTGCGSTSLMMSPCGSRTRRSIRPCMSRAVARCDAS